MPAQRLGGHGQIYAGKAFKERGDGDLALHPGERRAEAVVYAATPECQVLVGIAAQLENVGIVEVPLVAVGRTEYREDEISAGYPGARDLDILPGVALGRDLDGRRVPQQLFDRRLDKLWICFELLELLGMLHERERAAGD